MPTQSREDALTPEQARQRIAETSFQTREEPNGVGMVGLEPECFPIRTDASGKPTGRLPLSGEGSVLEALDRFAEESDILIARPANQPANGSGNISRLGTSLRLGIIFFY